MPRSSKDGPIVLLQGPLSGFFGAFAQYIQAKSPHAAIKVNFNLGDVLNERCPNRQSFRGEIEDLEAWYEKLFASLRPRAVVVFGDQRPVHVHAFNVCDRRQIPFFSFEEGYFRPDFVTFERGRNNAHSSLPRSAELITAAAASTAARRFGRNFFPMAISASKYYVYFWAGRYIFPNNVHHRNQSLRHEFGAWTRAGAQKLRWRKIETRLSESYAAKHSKNYFLVALQKYDDAQVFSHGRGWNAERVIEEVLASFAAHAPPGSRLVLKQHPLNTGYRNFQPLIDATVKRHGLGERVLYLQNGNQFDLLGHAKGLVTINSTMGLSAMSFGCPVLALGDCFYAMPGLAVDAATPDVIGRFWKAPPRIDAALFQRYRNYVVAHTQLNGDFYIRSAWPTLCEGALKRIIELS